MGRAAYVLTPYEDMRERACRLGDECWCTHTECRDGWLDEDETYTRNGRAYLRAVRCPVCRDSWQARVR